MSLIEHEKKLISIAEDVIKKWRKILQLDPLWKMYVEFFDNEDMPLAFGRLDTSCTEYYTATIEFARAMLEMDEETFEAEVNTVILHELLHLVAVDFYRTAQVAAGKNEKIMEELKYRYEQFTSRLQKSFVNFDKEFFKLQVSHMELDKKFISLKKLVEEKDNEIKQLKKKK